MAGAYATEAIVLRSFRTGEADRVVHLLSPTHGRVNVIAKGARRTKARLGARLEPLTRIDAILQPGRSELAVITGADVLWSGDDVRRDPLRALAATAGVEAVVRLFPEPEPDERLYRGLQRFLEVLAGSLGDDPRSMLDITTIGFVLKLLALAGWRPELGACVRCGLEVAVYDAQAGCAFCGGCGSGTPLSPAAAVVAGRMLTEPLGRGIAASLQDRREITRICRATAEAHGNVRLALLGQGSTAAG